MAMVEGRKCGNIISPNPNTITASENLGVELSRLMVANVSTAVIAPLIAIILLALRPLVGITVESLIVLSVGD